MRSIRAPSPSSSLDDDDDDDDVGDEGDGDDARNAAAIEAATAAVHGRWRHALAQGFIQTGGPYGSDENENDDKIARWAVRQKVRCTLRGAAELACKGSLEALRALKAAGLLDLDATVIAAACTGKPKTDGLTAGANVAVIEWLLEVEPKIELDANVFAAATGSEVMKVKAKALALLIKAECPLGNERQQADASRVVALRCSEAELRALHAHGGGGWDVRTIAGAVGAVDVNSGEPDVDDVAFGPQDLATHGAANVEDAIAKLRFSLSRGCEHGTVAQQRRICAIACEQLNSLEAMQLLRDAGFAADSEVVDAAARRGNAKLLAFLLVPSRSRSRKAWPDISDDDKLLLPSMLCGSKARLDDLPAAIAELKKAGCVFTAKDARFVVIRLGDETCSHGWPAAKLNGLVKELLHAGLPLAADATVAITAALRPHRGHAVLKALRSLKTPSPWDERAISAWNLASWQLAADGGSAWESETACREFEGRLRQLVESIKDGERSVEELRSKFAAAELHRRWLLTRRDGCPCGGRLHAEQGARKDKGKGGKGKASSSTSSSSSSSSSAAAEQPAQLPKGFLSDAATCDLIIKAGEDAIVDALEHWDGGRYYSRKYDDEGEKTRELLPSDVTSAYVRTYGAVIWR